MLSPHNEERDTEVIDAEEIDNSDIAAADVNSPNVNAASPTSAENIASDDNVDEETPPAATIISTAVPPAGLELNDDDSGPPLPAAMTEAMIDATKGSEGKQAGRPEIIDDVTGPTLPPSMVVDSFAKPAVRPEIIDDDTGPTSSLLSPPVPFGCREFEDGDDVNKLSKNMEAFKNHGQELEDNIGSMGNISDEDSTIVPSTEEMEMEVDYYYNANANAGIASDQIIDDEVLDLPQISGDIESNHHGQDEDNESLPIIPLAYLVEESDDDDDVNDDIIIAVQVLPWRKRKWTKIIFISVFVVVAALAIALGVSLSSNEPVANNDVVTPLLPLGYSNAPSFSIGPTFRPTTNFPSFEPTDVPSSSMVPSSSPTACKLKISSKMQQLDFQLDKDMFLDDDGAGISTPKVAVDGRNAVVVTGDGWSSIGYIIFYSLSNDGQWEHVNTFFEEYHEYYSVALSGKTAFVGFPYARSYKGSVYIYEQNSAGAWEKVQQIPTSGGEGADYSRFGWSLDVDGDLACVVNDRGAIHMLRRDDAEGWEEFDDYRFDLAHKCSIAGDTVAIRNWEGVILYKYDVDLGGFAPLQDTILSLADSTSLGQDYLVLSSNSSVIVYHREEKNETFTLLQKIDSSDFRENVKYVGDDDDLLMSDDFYFNNDWLAHGVHVALDEGIMVVGGYNHTHIFSLQDGYWEEIITLQGSYNNYQLSGRNLLVTQDDEVFSFNVEDCAPTPTQTPSISIAPTYVTR